MLTMVLTEPVSSRKVTRFSSILPSMRIIDCSVRKGTWSVRELARLGIGASRSSKTSSMRKSRPGAWVGAVSNEPFAHAAASKMVGRLTAQFVLRKQCNIDLMFPQLSAYKPAILTIEIAISSAGF